MARSQKKILDMEREFEERVEANRRYSSPNSQKDTRSKMPLHFRILAWCGVILLCFVVGYHGTSYMLTFLDKHLLKDEGVTSGDVRGTPIVNADARLDMQKINISLFYPKGESLVEDKADVIVNTREDNIQDAVLKLIELSGLFDDTVVVKHVFRNADTVYLNFSASFASALNKAGARLSTLFITGIVRTMRENFSPITKVRFLVDSKLESAGAPVDLTATWQLPR